jgi:hypothetical protein
MVLTVTKRRQGVNVRLKVTGADLAAPVDVN